MQLLIALFFCVANLCYAIPNGVKKEYATKMHHAFVLQSLGKSTTAFYTFDDGYKQALQAGENPAKLKAIYNHFQWYR